MRKYCLYKSAVIMIAGMVLTGCVPQETDVSNVNNSELVLINDDEFSDEIDTEDPSEEEAPVSEISEGYYAETFGTTGDDLKAILNDIISEDHGALSYDQVYSALEDTDEDPKDPSKVLLFYKNVGVPDNYQRASDDGDIWNREHVWAKSHGDFGTAKGPGTDLHMIRATDASINARRGHLDFDYSDNVFEEAPDTFVDKDSFEPRDEVKGDVARMLFYMAVRYEGEDGEVDLELSDRTDTYYRNRDKYGEHGKLTTLLEWHFLDPVDELERFRHERIYEIQGNRNPFIDYPEFVDLIWGDLTVELTDNHNNGTETSIENQSEIISITDARYMEDGQIVRVTGTVTFNEKATTMYVQNQDGGIRIDSHGSNVNLHDFIEGQKLEILGRLDTYKGEKEIIVDSYEDMIKLNGDTTLEIVQTSIIDLSDGLYQGQLVQVSGVEVIEVSGNTLVIEDGDGYRLDIYFGSAEGLSSDSFDVGTYCDVEGIATWYDGPQIKLTGGEGFGKD